MITIVAALSGIALGMATAWRRGGKWLDALQYGAGYGIAFTLLGMLATIVIDRNFFG